MFIIIGCFLAFTFCFVVGLCGRYGHLALASSLHLALSSFLCFRSASASLRTISMELVARLLLANLLMFNECVFAQVSEDGSAYFGQILFGFRRQNTSLM